MSVTLPPSPTAARPQATPHRRRPEPTAPSGFWEGNLGYPQAFVTVLTALTIGMVFHLRLGYRHPIPYSVALYGILAYALAWGFAGRCWQRRPLMKWISGIPFAIATIVGVGAMAAVGAIAPSSAIQRVLGIPSLFSSWMFWMLLLLMQTNLITATARRCVPLTYKNLCFTTSHLGLLIVLGGGVLSGASLERARLMVPIGEPTARGETLEGATLTLPFTLALRSFHLENFPPTLAVAKLSAEGKVETLPGSRFLKPGMVETVGGYRVTTLEFLPQAALVGEVWRSAPLPTAAPAARIAVQDASGKSVGEGWVSCGSVDTAGSLVQVAKEAAIVMPQLRPREYRATLQIEEPGRPTAERELRVNHPITVGGYRLYLVSYDEKMGSASEYAVVEAIRDRGVPVVYTGMFLLLAGAALTLWSGVRQEAKEAQL